MFHGVGEPQLLAGSGSADQHEHDYGERPHDRRSSAPVWHIDPSPEKMRAWSSVAETGVFRFKLSIEPERRVSTRT
jgi:hypothetical protein